MKIFNEINQHLFVTGYIYATAQSQSRLGSQTCYFNKRKRITIHSPRHHLHRIMTRYHDKIQLLAFVYQSTIKDLPVNASSNQAKLF